MNIREGVSMCVGVSQHVFGEEKGILSRHICLTLISFAWHRDPPVSVVFNNNLDGEHSSRSAHS